MNLTERRQHRERGQTIALVAVSMVSLLAIAALAIDLTTLYVSRGEIQRAVDTAALAGAKAFVDSGVTTDPSNPTLQGLAQRMADVYVTAAVSQNNVAGSPAQLVSTPSMNFGLSGNPRITVSLRKANLPVFFARIWGNTAASVSATATAEAYNPSYSQSNTGSFVPSAPRCVKPFLVPNIDQASGQPYLDPVSGTVNTAISPLGEQITLTSACKPGRGQGQGCQPPSGGGNQNWPKAGEYLPMAVSGTHTYCPSPSAQGCQSGGGSDYEQSTECCDGTIFSSQRCGSSASAMWDSSINPGGPNGPTQHGLQCLIHTTSVGPPPSVPEQDTLNVTSFQSGTGPLQISPGTFNQSRYNIPAASFVATSDSIVTVPLFEPTSTIATNPQVTVVGFLQLFVNYVGPSPQTDVNAYIVNVAGCGNALASGSAVSGGGVSPIPVRLIHN